MITRLWHGYTKPTDADAYQELLLTKIFPEIGRIKGSAGSYVLRRELQDEIEFITLTFWESIAAVRQFAGPDYETAVVPPEARRLLVRYDEKAIHYDSFRGG